MALERRTPVLPLAQPRWRCACGTDLPYRNEMAEAAKLGLTAQLL